MFPYPEEAVASNKTLWPKTREHKTRATETARCNRRQRKPDWTLMILPRNLLFPADARVSRRRQRSLVYYGDAGFAESSSSSNEY